MHAERQNDARLQKVADMVGEIKFAMLTTAEADGTLRSRPMSTMSMDEDGNLWFFTALDAPKVDEATRHTQVNVSYARIDKQDYLSISGLSQIVRDRDKMRQLWSPWIKAWFPQGLDDPNLALLKVSITDAEYWDAPGSAVMRLYGLAKAVATGDHDALGENRKVHVR